MESKTMTVQGAAINPGMKYKTEIVSQMFNSLHKFSLISTALKDFMDVRRSMLNLRNMKNC